MSTQQELRSKAHQHLIGITNAIQYLKGEQHDIYDAVHAEVDDLWKTVDEATQHSTVVERLAAIITDLMDEQNARYLSAIQLLDLIVTDLESRDADGSPQFSQNTLPLDSLVEVVAKRAVAIITEHEAFPLMRDWSNRPYVAFADPGASVATLVTEEHYSENSHALSFTQGEKHVSFHVDSVRKLMPYLVNFARTGYIEYETMEELRKAFSED